MFSTRHKGVETLIQIECKEAKLASQLTITFNRIANDHTPINEDPLKKIVRLVTTYVSSSEAVAIL